MPGETLIAHTAARSCDPQLGQYPAASLLKVVAKNAVAQLRESVKGFLARSSLCFWSSIRSRSDGSRPSSTRPCLVVAKRTPSIDGEADVHFDLPESRAIALFV